MERVEVARIGAVVDEVYWPEIAGPRSVKPRVTESAVPAQLLVLATSELRQLDHMLESN